MSKESVENQAWKEASDRIKQQGQDSRFRITLYQDSVILQLKKKKAYDLYIYLRQKDGRKAEGKEGREGKEREERGRKLLFMLFSQEGREYNHQ